MTGSPARRRQLGRGYWALALVSALAALLAAAPAQAAGPWFTLLTEHFAVHFPGGQEALAQRAAAIAEEVHPVLTRDTGYAPKKRTQLVLTDFTDLANGSASVTFDPTITVYLAVPSVASGYDSGFGGNEDWLRYVITHEYAHILHMDMHQGLPALVRRVFGTVPIASTPNELMPMAFIEGYAVREETRLTRGGRGGSAYYEMFLRTAALDGRLFRMDQALGLYWLREWSPTANVYLYGDGFWQYIEDRFGSDKVVALNREFSTGRYLGISFAIRKVLGVDMACLWQEWQADLTARYRRQADQVGAEGLTRTRAVTTGGYYHQAPAYSPDGALLAYIAAGPSLEPAIRLRRMTGEDEQLVTGHFTDNSRLAWSPDGTRLAYGRLEYAGRQLRSDLYIYQLGSHRETRLTTGQRANDPAWSPDGRQVAFVSLESGRSVLKVVDIETNQVREVSSGSGLAQYGSPAWRPDGRVIAVGYKGEGDDWDIALVEVVTGRVERLWSDPAIDRNPAWTADGRYLLFDSDRSGINNIYAFDTVERGLFRLTNVLTGAFDPEPTPGGQSLAMMVYSSAGYDIHLTSLDRSSWVTVAAPDPGGEESGARPSIAPAVSASEPQRYRAWATLAPKFWLPVPYPGDGGVDLGVITAGQDALARTSYLAQLRYDRNLQSLAGSLDLDHRMYDEGPRLQLAVSRSGGLTEGPGGEPPTSRDQYAAAVTWDYPGTASRQGLTVGATATVEKALGTGEATRQTELSAQLDSSGTNGRDVRSSQRESSVLLSHETEGDSYGTALLVGVGQSWSKDSYPRLAVALNAGVAKNARGLSLGSSSDTFFLRGVGAEHAHGDRGFTVTLEAIPLHQEPEVGYRDVPVFWNRLQGAAFLDFGTIYDGSTRVSASSVGWETRSRIDLLYGVAPLVIKCGVAVPLDDSRQPSLYISAALGLDIPGQGKARASWRK